MDALAVSVAAPYVLGDRVALHLTYAASTHLCCNVAHTRGRYAYCGRLILAHLCVSLFLCVGSVV